jgi:hypothetical protein
VSQDEAQQFADSFRLSFIHVYFQVW